MNITHHIYIEYETMDGPQRTKYWVMDQTYVTSKTFEPNWWKSAEVIKKLREVLP